MTNRHEALERIAGRQADVRAEAHRRMNERQRLQLDRIALASFGPPKPHPPGIRRTSDWGLRALRERCWWELRRRKYP